jgi:uncharacterized repeat protein (TIGR01451 family)
MTSSPGTTVTVSITVTNPGAVPIVDAQVVERRPSSLTFLTSSDGTLDQMTGDIGRVIDGLAPGEAKALTYTALISDSDALPAIACTAGRDASGTEATACDDVVVGQPRHLLQCPLT